MQSKRVLVVDDDPKIIAALTANLEFLGDEYIIESAESAADAIAKIQHYRYALVITDLYMPGVDGWELIKRIRLISPMTQIVLVTGYHTPEVESKAKEFKISRCIAKPFRGQILLNAAFEALQEGETSSQAIMGYTDGCLEAIESALGELRQKTGARCTMLADSKGSLIAHVGHSSGIDVATLLALAAGEFATATEISRCLGDKHALNLNFHEGSNWEFYSTSILNELVMVLLFDRKTQHSRIGMVWLFARRTMDVISECIHADEGGRLDGTLGEEFKLDLAAELDQHFVETSTIVEDEDVIQVDESSESAAEQQTTTEWQTAIPLDEAQALGIIPPDLLPQAPEKDLEEDKDDSLSLG